MRRIRAERLRKRWSQTELGFHARVSAADVSKIETGRLIPFSGQAARLAAALGCRVEELLDDSDPSPRD